MMHAGLLQKRKSYGISGQVFGLILSFHSSRRLLVVLNGKALQEHPVNARVLQGSNHDSTHFLLCINDLSDYVVCNIVIYADDIALYFKFDHASNFW